jgi:putative transposase
MARLPRLTLSGYPHHVILRGNNRQGIFLSVADREFMLSVLAEEAKQHGVEVHAYVLMSNHIHLLLTPQRDQALPRMMQALGRRYVRHFNLRHGRTGTLWEGRYRSSLIQTERHLLACMVYLDLNPVRAGLVADPAEHPWSSHGHYTGARVDKTLTPHAMYWQLGNTPFDREAAYTDLVRAGLSANQVGALTQATLSGWALGDEGFKRGLQSLTERRVSPGRAGRPLKTPQT